MRIVKRMTRQIMSRMVNIFRLRMESEADIETTARLVGDFPELIAKVRVGDDIDVCASDVMPVSQERAGVKIQWSKEEHGPSA